MKWATAGGIEATEDQYGDFTALKTAFPAATFCGGTVQADPGGTVSGLPPDIAIEGSGSYKADFSGGISLGHWRADHALYNKWCYYSLSSKLPTVEQLLAVSGFDTHFCSNVKRKATALAAGWLQDKSENYWTGQVFFDGSSGRFLALFVDLSYGLSFSNYVVTEATPAVACIL
ncbi:MAG: hypothetical protein LBS44_05395 [Deltaproteobacteria bacterium]|jgi:hypothetical protein|nr:hypothetical protein [Deltaproteobacteria bacterium]